jgi:RHS repeat-associated protein
VIITNAKGVKVHYVYNTLNQKIKKINGDNTYKEFFYDKNGNLIKQINEDDTIIQYSYDSLNRKVNIIVNGQIEQEFTYDKLSRLVSTKDYNQGRETNEVNYSYDSKNNIIKEIQNGIVVKKSYDKNSNQLNLKVDDIVIQSNSYNSQNRLTTIEDIANFRYDKDSQLNQIEYNNGITNSITTDKRNREENREYKLNDSTLYSQQTQYDTNSNVVKENIFKSNQTIIKEYTYDSQDRLTKDIHNNHIYKYDQIGNQIFTTQNNQNEYRTVNLDNEYTDITNTAIEYDKNGNIKLYKNKEFIYDYLNRLVELKQDGNTIATYSYDVSNRRVSKTLTSSNTTIEYIYNDNQVVQEYENDTLTNTYIYASYIDDPVAYKLNDQTYYYIKDRQYSIQAISDNFGNIVESYSYNSFGIMTIKDENQNVILKSKVNNSITYTGRRYDSESELYYYRNRMYSATLGRFLSNDPKGYVDGMNLYAYVKNNPLKYLDAFGTMKLETKDIDELNSFGYEAGYGSDAQAEENDFNSAPESGTGNNDSFRAREAFNRRQETFNKSYTQRFNTSTPAKQFSSGSQYATQRSLYGEQTDYMRQDNAVVMFKTTEAIASTVALGAKMTGFKNVELVASGVALISKSMAQMVEVYPKPMINSNGSLNMDYIPSYQK